MMFHCLQFFKKEQFKSTPKRTHIEVCETPSQLYITILAILNQGQVDLAPLEE